MKIRQARNKILQLEKMLRTVTNYLETGIDEAIEDLDEEDEEDCRNLIAQSRKLTDG